MPRTRNKKTGLTTAPAATLYALYLTSFLFALHYALPLYISSSFLSQFFSQKTLGLLYAASSLILIFLFVQMPRILKTFGALRTTLAFILLEIASLAGLAYGESALTVALVFIANQALVSVIFFNLDVFFETFSKDATTGTVRGIMLTVFNVAILLGPLLAGIILTNGDYFKVFLVSAALLVPALWIFFVHFSTFKDSKYKKVAYIETVRDIILARHPKDEIRHALVASLLMRFFYSWMIIYTPLYLHGDLGFSWSAIGTIFTIMLLPFVLFEAAVGAFADARSNEPTVMRVGFLIAAVFTGILPFVGSSSLALWAVLLFGTRVGISFVEVASESYFFKHVTSADTNALSVFRNANPVAFLIGPALASLLLLFMPMQYLFLVLALVLLYGAVSIGRPKKKTAARANS